MIQTLALFLDSYRELNSKKLFWITIGLSGLVVLIFLGVGINSAGMSFFGYQWNMPVNTTLVDRTLFYKSLFLELGVNMWLTWAATILALISTGGIFPDLISGGSIDLYLSKPISRIRLFLTKYFTGLLFVALQVGVFCAASLFVLRVRADSWTPKVFLAVPAILLFYSYIYCFCVLVGVLTRSTITAILITILFWCMIWGVHVIETKTLTAQCKSEIMAARLDRQVAQVQAQIQGNGIVSRWLKNDAPQRLAQLQIDQHEANADLAFTTLWHHRFYMLEAIVPKTSETVSLMQRWLVSASEIKRAGGDMDEPDSNDEPHPFMFGLTTDDVRAKTETEKVIRSRSMSWVIGTSLAFEVFVVGFAAWLFCRRDY